MAGQNVNKQVNVGLSFILFIQRNNKYKNKTMLQK